MKYIYLLTALLFSNLLIKAQDMHFEPGLKAGLNISTLHKSMDPKFDPRISFNIGGLAHIHLNKHFAIQPELVFSGQGAKYTVGDTVYHSNFNYLNLPVLLQYMIGTGFRLETGPQFGLRLSAKSKTKYNTNDIKTSFKSYDISWAFGAGYLAASGLGIDARFNLGLSNIYAGTPGVFKNRVFQLGVFYQFKKVHTEKK